MWLISVFQLPKACLMYKQPLAIKLNSTSYLFIVFQHAWLLKEAFFFLNLNYNIFQNIINVVWCINLTKYVLVPQVSYWLVKCWCKWKESESVSHGNKVNNQSQTRHEPWLTNVWFTTPPSPNLPTQTFSTLQRKTVIFKSNTARSVGIDLICQ